MVWHLEIWPDNRRKQCDGQLARVSMVPRKIKVDGSTMFNIGRVVVGPDMLCSQVPAIYDRCTPHNRDHVFSDMCLVQNTSRTRLVVTARFACICDSVVTTIIMMMRLRFELNPDENVGTGGAHSIRHLLEISLKFHFNNSPQNFTEQ